MGFGFKQPLVGEKRCVTTLITAAKETSFHKIDHFTVVCSVTWPVNGSEAGGDLALIQTSMP